MSAGPLLYLPNSVRPSGGWAKQPKPKPKPPQKPKSYLKWIEALGRKSGTPHGSHIDDLSAQQKAIWLCFACRNKFDHRRAQYFYEKNLRVRGACDACRTFDTEAHLFIHQSLLTEPGNRSRHGCSWMPRNTL